MLLSVILTIFLFTAITGGYCGLSVLLELGKIGFWELGMAEPRYWWTERYLKSPLFLFFFWLFTYLSTYLLYIYLFIDLFIPFSFSLSLFYLSSYLPLYLFISPLARWGFLNFILVISSSCLVLLVLLLVLLVFLLLHCDPCQCTLPDLNHDHPRQCTLPGFNHNYLRPVFPAGF